jgi:hypothetical protein
MEWRNYSEKVRKTERSDGWVKKPIDLILNLMSPGKTSLCSALPQT